MNRIRKSTIGVPMRAKSASSRSGGMLILVLVLMAVGVILITSALSVTAATRNHFFVDAQQSQARLTVTSAAKTIVDAILVSQEIPDARVEALAASHSTITFYSASGEAYSATTGSNFSVAPAVGSSSKARTTATFSEIGGQIVIDFVSYIDADVGAPATENLRVVLKEKPPVAPISGFTSMIKAGTSSTTNNFPRFRVGYDLINQGESGNALYTGGNMKPHESIYNYMILHGNSFLATSGDSHYYSDVVFTDHVTTGSGSKYFGDIVFWGDNAGIKDSGGDGIQTPGDIYFLGKNSSVASAFKAPGGIASSWTWLIGNTIYLRNTSFKTNFGGAITGINFPNGFYADANSVADYRQIGGAVPSNYYNVHSSASVTYDTGTVPYSNRDSDSKLASLRNNASFYYGADMEAAITRTVPSTAQAEAMVEYSTEADVRANATRITNLSSNQTFTGSEYYIDLSATSALNAHLTFNLQSNDITLYIIGSGRTLNFGNQGRGALKFINGGPYWGHIVLLHNVNMSIPAYNYGGPTANGDIGILATTHSYGEWRPGDQGTTPYLYVIGLGGNTFSADREAIVDGYYGMYGSNGTIIINNRPHIYGRFEAAYVKYSSGDYVEMPYCPTPWEKSESTEQPLETKFMVDYYEYT